MRRIFAAAALVALAGLLAAEYRSFLVVLWRLHFPDGLPPA